MNKIDLRRLLLLFFFFSVLLLRADWARGQTTVTVGGGASGTCPFLPTATWTTPPTGVTFSNWARGSGVTCASAASGLSGSSFSTTYAAGITNGDYYTVTVTADNTHAFTLSSITWLTAVSSGTATFTVAYSNNGGAVTTFGTVDQTGTTTNTFSGSVTVASGTSIVIYLIPTNTVGGATVRFNNNSTFTVTAFSAPHLVVTGTPTDHGSVCVGSSAPPVTYTITNNGAVTASGITVTSSDPQFVVSNLSATSIPVGGTATYTVTFTPTSAGVKSATITTASSTSGTNTATMALTGTGLALPAPTISGTTGVCVNSNTTLTPSITGGEWSSDSPSVATIDPSTGVVLGLSAGSSVMTYSVTVTGCVGTTTTTVTVNPLPTLTVVNPPTVCSPTTVDITSASVQTTNTGTTTKYYDSYTLALAGGASNVTTPAAISTSGIYYIRAELATGCYVVAPVTVTINTSPSFAPVAVQPTCLTNGSITFPELTGGTYTYSYSINGGSATSVTPSGGAITISVPMGIQTASTYSITVTRTDVTPNCPTVKTVNIAAIPFCVTPTAQVADPCSCNNDQTSDGSQTGTFNETIAVNGSGSGQTWTVTSVAPLVAGTAPTLTVGTVLSAVANSATNGIDDDGDGSTDEADEANMYNVMFQHTDDKGYTATIEGPAAVGTAGNQILNISNVCKYPEIIFGANPLGTYCVSGSSSMPSISLSATEATSMTGTMTFSGSGVSSTTFTPPGAGTYTITATFTSTPGTGKGGTAATPVAPNNSCITKESKTTTVTDSRCTAFPQ